MNDVNPKKLTSDFVDILRHDPDRIGLSPDITGWVSLRDAWEGYQSCSEWEFDENFFTHTLHHQNRGRLEFNSGNVRVISGHSVDVEYDLSIPPIPSVLYLVIKTNTLAHVEVAGIVPWKTTYTKVFLTLEEAVKDGKKRKVRGKGIHVQIHTESVEVFTRAGCYYVKEVLPYNLTLTPGS